jgi:hypothetical protein
MLNNNETNIESMIQLALARGFWSIWMTIFENQSEVKKALIESFPGTCVKCFDSDGNPINRNGDNI